MGSVSVKAEEQVALTIPGAYVRVQTPDGQTGIRFAVSMTKDAYEQNASTITETGTLVIPEDYYAQKGYTDATYTVETAKQADSKIAYTDTTTNWYPVDASGYATNVEEDIVAYQTMVYVYDIDEEWFDVDFIVRGYANVNGQAVYSALYENSMSYIAKQAIDMDASLESALGGFLKTYQVAFMVDGAPQDTVEVKYGEQVSAIGAPEKAGYEFKYWAYNGVQFDFATPITSNLTLEAVFEEVVVQDIVKYSADKLVLVDPATTDATLSYDGKILTYTANAQTGPFSRMLKIDGISSYEQNTYIALTLNLTISDYAYMIGVGEEIGWLNENNLFVNSSLGNWLTIVFKVNANTEVNAGSGVFAFIDLSVSETSATAQFSDVYVMTEAGYAEFSQINGVVEYTGKDLVVLDASTASMANFEYDEKNVLTYTMNSGNPWDRDLTLKGIASYKAGTYVAIRMNIVASGSHIFYGVAEVPLTPTYLNDNKLPETFGLGKWVYAIYHFESDVVVGNNAGVFCFLDNTNASIQISNVYVMGEAGYAEFTKQPDIMKFAGTDVALLDPNLNGVKANVSYSEGILTYTALDDSPWFRELMLSGVSGYKAGTYLAIRMKFIGNATEKVGSMYNYVFGTNGNLVFINDNKVGVTADYGVWVTAIYQFTADTTVGDDSGTFLFLDLNENPGTEHTVQISDVYVMTPAGYAQFLAQA